MADIDGNNLFALIVQAAATADAIASDTRQSAADRASAARIRDAAKAFKGQAFPFRQWVPVAVSSPGANAT